MLNSKTTINIAIIILILLIIYFAYALLSGNNSTEKLSSGAVKTEVVDDTIIDNGVNGPTLDNKANTDTGSATLTSVSASDAEAEFVRVLNSLQNVTLSGDIFNNEIFKNRLQDFSRPLPLRFSGRINPFAPFGPSDLVGIPNAASLIQSSTSLDVSSSSNLKVSQPAKSTKSVPKTNPKTNSKPTTNRTPSDIPDDSVDAVDLGDQ
jgi:hypothetical protein